MALRPKGSRCRGTAVVGRPTLADWKRKIWLSRAGGLRFSFEAPFRPCYFEVLM